MASDFNNAINKSANTNEGSYLNSIANRGNTTFSALPSDIKENIESLEKALPITKQIEEEYEKLAKIQEKLGKGSDEYIEKQKEIVELEKDKASKMDTIAKYQYAQLRSMMSLEEKLELDRQNRLNRENKATEERNKKSFEIAKKRAELDEEREEANKLPEGKERDEALAKIDKKEKALDKDEKQAKNEERAIRKNDTISLAIMARQAEKAGDMAKASELRDIKNTIWAERRTKLQEELKNIAKAGLSENTRVAKEILASTTQYASRLQGYTKNYAEILNKINKQIGLNPFISQEKMITNLNSLLDKGIAYNIEQRSFLVTISDKVAATFDKQNETLERLIRIQQADSTAARLGLEASLTKLFNDWFEDTSYLASNTLDQVTAALIDAESQMTRNQAVEFEYTIQKWLGSLYSLGLSQNAVTSIAGGLGQLASGNISALQGTPLQTLFALSSSKSNLSYSDMLINSIDGSSVNELLKAMVEYLREIAEGDNQVVKSAYGKIFGLSQADFRALQNITPKDITNIWKLQSNYSQAIQEVNEQLTFSNLSSRSTMAEMVQNVMNNFTWNWGSKTAASPIVSAMIQINDLINGMTSGGGIPIPSILGFGTGFFANSNLNNLVTSVGQAITLIGSIGDIFDSGLDFGLDLSRWDAKEYTRRGSGFTGIASGLRRGTSISSYVASGSTSDMESSTLEEQSKKAKETKKSVFSEEEEKDFSASTHKFDELYDLFNDRKTDGTVKAIKVISYFDETASPLQPIIDNQNSIISILRGEDSKDTLVGLLQDIKTALNNPKAQLNIDGSKFATQLRAALQGIIAGGTEIGGIPSELTIGDALIGIYDILNGNSSKAVKVSVDSVSRSVPGFNGIGNKIAVTGIY